MIKANDNITEIEKYISIDESDSRFLYAQVLDGLRNWVSEKQPGDKIAPEREISSTLGIHRNTVRKAIRSLVEEGLLIRRVKGTFIADSDRAGVAEKEEEPEAAFHPMSMMPFAGLTAKNTLSFALYEDRPRQKKFWEKTVQSFNQNTSGAEVEIRWVDHLVRDPYEYCSYIKEIGADIFLMSEHSLNVFLENNSIAEVPERILDTYSNPEYLKDEFKIDFMAHTDHLVPIYFSSWVFLYNKDILDSRGIDISSDLNKSIDTVLLKVAENSPKNSPLCGSIWSCLLGMGIALSAEKFEKDVILKHLSHTKKLLDINPNAFLLTENPPWQSYFDFASGKIPFYCGPTSPVLTNNLKLPFASAGNWLVPDKGLHQHGAFISA
ncbi:MAG: GntR family transcriptional regulator, partial [Planctomycetota bacterium]